MAWTRLLAVSIAAPVDKSRISGVRGILGRPHTIIPRFSRPKPASGLGTHPCMYPCTLVYFAPGAYLDMQPTFGEERCRGPGGGMNGHLTRNCDGAQTHTQTGRASSL